MRRELCREEHDIDGLDRAHGRAALASDTTPFIEDAVLSRFQRSKAAFLDATLAHDTALSIDGWFELVMDDMSIDGLWI